MIGTTYPLSASQKYGLSVEQWVFEKLLKLGYSPSVPVDFCQPGVDLYANGLPIEVKAARRTLRRFILASGEIKYRHRWQWCISPTHQAEYGLILVADTPQNKRLAFIVPGSQVGQRSHLQLTSHPLKYQGWMSQYLEKWSVIDYLAHKVYKSNGPLFEQWEREGERLAA